MNPTTCSASPLNKDSFAISPYSSQSLDIGATTSSSVNAANLSYKTTTYFAYHAIL